MQQAVELTPEYAQAWAHLSIAESELYSAGTIAGPLEPPGMPPKRRSDCSRTWAMPITRSGFFYYFCLQDFDRALVELDEARKRSPNDGNVIFYTALVKRRQGKLDEAIELQKKATIFDPRNPDMWSNLGRSFAESVTFARLAKCSRAFAVSPDETKFIAEKAEVTWRKATSKRPRVSCAAQTWPGGEVILGEYVT